MNGANNTWLCVTDNSFSLTLFGEEQCTFIDLTTFLHLLSGTAVVMFGNYDRLSADAEKDNILCDWRLIYTFLP